jgi:N-acetylmuramic acid 6-phosphate etherase
MAHQSLTETRNPASLDLDSLSTLEICRLINREDAQLAAAVAEVLPAIAQAADAVAAALESGGRLFYMGAGTSGRLGVLDAAELYPTFNISAAQTIALIAGGAQAIFQAVEAAEDNLEQGQRELQEHHFSAADILIGIAASGHTPYVLGGLAFAQRCGAKSIAIVCNPGSPMAAAATITIELRVGAEIITGSTRMKAGTAQKLVLNMLSTTAMVKLGKVYSNLMVDLRPTNAKLRQRAIRIVQSAVAVEPAEAGRLLELAGWETKTAVVMGLMGVSAQAARAGLAENRGHIRHTVTGSATSSE